MTRKLLTALLALPVVLGTLGLAPTFARPAQDEATEESSLYDRLGGVYAISTVVDSFLERILVNETLNANPAIAAARDRVPKAGLKFQLTTMVCQATGGPHEYVGRSMMDAHAHLGITEEEWGALAADFKATLDEFEVPEAEQAELFAIVGSTKGDIVRPDVAPTEANPRAIYPASADTSLYARLGGVYNIATVVDAFIERLLVNDILNANPAIEASRAAVPKAGLKVQVTALVCQVTGGPYEYQGRDMKTAHEHLNITEAEWGAMAADFKATLDQFGVPEAEQQELFAIVGTTHGDIVTGN